MSSRRGPRQDSVTASFLDRASEDVTKANQARGDEQDDQRDDHEDDAHCRPETPIEPLLDLLDDELADHLIVKAAEQRRRDVEAEGQDEHQEAARDDARQAERYENAEEGGHRRR